MVLPFKVSMLMCAFNKKDRIEYSPDEIQEMIDSVSRRDYAVVYGTRIFSSDTELTATLPRVGVRPFEVPVSYYSRSREAHASVVG
jgi:hypothetical protein